MPRISVFPNWNTNPYLNMLFLEARGRGWTVTGGTRVGEHLMREIPQLVAGDVLHIQWTSPFEAASKNGREFDRLVDAFEAATRQAKDRGVTVLWTVHNVMSHGSKFFEEEVRLAQVLSDLADRIIILNSHTELAVDGLYALPTHKLVHLPHASYKGIYPPRITRGEVARQLGIPEHLRIMGFVGAIRPYKGVGDFLEAARLVTRDLPQCGVVLAGDTSAWAMREVDEHMLHSAPVFRRHTLLPDDDMSVWMSACDVLVLPYRGILNSGSMMLAASFGVPVVLPRLPHLQAEFGEEAWVRFFVPSEDDTERWANIAEAVQDLIRSREASVQAAQQFASSYTTLDMARAYANLLDEVVPQARPQR